jgi:protein-tyrosine phosphatase
VGTESIAPSTPGSSAGRRYARPPVRRGLVRRFLKKVQHAPDRLRHSARRREALEAVASRPRPTLVLVVCHGNVCRSPFAAAALKRALGDSDIQVASAGFVGSDRPPPAEASAVAAALGLDLSAHRSQPLLPDLVRSAGLIVVMDAAQQRGICAGYGRYPGDVIILGDLDPEPIETRGIRDPVSQPAEVFQTVYTRIERCVGELAAVLKACQPG